MDSGVGALGKGEGGGNTGGSTDGTDEGAMSVVLNGFPSFLHKIHSRIQHSWRRYLTLQLAIHNTQIAGVRIKRSQLTVLEDDAWVIQPESSV